MTERSDVYTWKGNPVTLVGNPVSVGDKAPDSTLTAADLSDVSLSRWDGKVRVINVVASLDTPVCDTQTKKLNEQVSKWGDDIVLLTVSMDLPFAQKRWCGSTGSEQMVTLSDFRLRDFADKWGLYVKEKGLHARSVFVVGKDGTVKYAEITKDLTNEPSYGAALETVEGLLG